MEREARKNHLEKPHEETFLGDKKCVGGFAEGTPGECQGLT